MVIIRKKHKESSEEKDARQQKEQEQAVGIQDQYQARGFELVSWVQDHKGLVTSLIAIVVVGGALFSAYLFYQKRAAEIASSAYLEAIKPIEGIEKAGEENLEKFKKAKDSLSELGKSHGKSGVFTLANLYAGHLALESNDSKGAVEHYEAAAKSISKSNSLYPLALIGLAYAQEKNGDAKTALTTFESLIELKGNSGKDLALWEAARLANELKDGERAKKNLARLLEDYPASIYEKNAQRLKASIQ